MYSEIYQRVESACCYITVFLGEEKVSEGTGFAFTPNGLVLTAAHVVTGPLFKRGIIGNIRRIVAENKTAGEQVECEVMYVDNVMNSGASGGPLFNANGEAVGVISQRAVTAVDTGKEAMLKVPSGCTIALSLAPLRYVSKMTGGGA